MTTEKQDELYDKILQLSYEYDAALKGLSSDHNTIQSICNQARTVFDHMDNETQKRFIEDKRMNLFMLIAKLGARMKTNSSTKELKINFTRMKLDTRYDGSINKYPYGGHFASNDGEDPKILVQYETHSIVTSVPTSLTLKGFVARSFKEIDINFIPMFLDKTRMDSPVVYSTEIMIRKNSLEREALAFSPIQIGNISNLNTDNWTFVAAKQIMQLMTILQEQIEIHSKEVGVESHKITYINLNTWERAKRFNTLQVIGESRNKSREQRNLRPTINSFNVEIINDYQFPSRTVPITSGYQIVSNSEDLDFTQVANTIKIFFMNYDNPFTADFEKDDTVTCHISPRTIFDTRTVSPNQFLLTLMKLARQFSFCLYS